MRVLRGMGIAECDVRKALGEGWKAGVKALNPTNYPAIRCAS